MEITKQIDIENIWEQLEEKSWENASMNSIEISMNVQQYLALKNQFKAMHKEQIVKAYQEGYSQGYARCEESEDYYYEQTYGKNEEEQSRQFGE